MGHVLSKAEIESKRAEARAVYARLDALMHAFVERHCELDPVAFAPKALMIAAWHRFVDANGLGGERRQYEDGLKYYNDCISVRFPSAQYAHPHSPELLLGIRLVSMPEEHA
jgi:hypothetical protein